MVTIASISTAMSPALAAKTAGLNRNALAAFMRSIVAQSKAPSLLRADDGL
jgi:hypothetical protein